MTKIIIDESHEKVGDEMPYTIEGTITISDEANASSFIEACVTAMRTEGYAEISIMQALYENYGDLKETLSVVSDKVAEYEAETA